MKKINYKVLSPVNVTIGYFATPEFNSDELSFNYLMREPGEWVQVPLAKAKVHIKELDETVKTNENGIVKLALKNGLYHAKIVDFGKTDVPKQFHYEYVKEPKILREAKQKILDKQKYRKFVVNIGDYYYAEGSRRTKIQEKDIPEYYVNGYAWHTPGVYIKAMDVKDLYYKRSKIAPESFKYDMLAISYDKPIEIVEDENGYKDFKNAEIIISGSFIEDFVEGVEKYSPETKGLAKVKEELQKSILMHEDIRKAEKESGWEAGEAKKKEYAIKLFEEEGD